MARFWGLSRRQTVMALAAAVVVGVVIALVTAGGGPTRTDRTVPDVVRVSRGTPGARSAVWVFGFRTLRFDPRRRAVQQVDVTGFGSVQGVDGRVYMYDPGTGRVGVLTSRRNTLTDLARIPGGVAQDDTFAPVLAPLGSSLWLVSAPGRVTRFDLRQRTTDPARRGRGRADAANDGDRRGTRRRVRRHV